MALLFAANRWGNGAGIYNYQAEAQKILDVMLHKNEEDNGLVTNMFDPETKQVVFVPSGRNATFTDPSYHLPAFYELWARWADKDNDFWQEAAQVSRAFWKTTAHPETGLMPDYAEFDGTPNCRSHSQRFPLRCVPQCVQRGARLGVVRRRSVAGGAEQSAAGFLPRRRGWISTRINTRSMASRCPPIDHRA